MTLDDKSASLPGGEPRVSDTLYDYAGSPSTYSFSDVVNEACEKLMSQQIKYSIRRIHKMEEFLCSLEKELDDFLLQKNRNY